LQTRQAIRPMSGFPRKPDAMRKYNCRSQGVKAPRIRNKKSQVM